MGPYSEHSGRTRAAGLMLASAMVAIAVVSIGLLVVILPEGLDQKPSTFRIEVGKALLQLGIVGVVGAALSFFASNYQRNAQLLDKARDIAREEKRAELERQSEDDRERIEYVDKLHSSILSSALDAYCEIKKIRRLMRARAIRVVSEEKHILAAPLDEYMVRLNDAQIQLENLVREIDTSGHVLFDADEVKEALRSMEKYLNTVIDEYEKKRRTIDVETGSTQLKDLPALHSFLHSSKDDPALPTGERKFGDEFADNARVVQARIRTYLLQTAEDRLKLAKRLPSQAGISIEPESSGTE